LNQKRTEEKKFSSSLRLLKKKEQNIKS